MNLDAPARRRSTSPASPGRASPVPRAASRRIAEEGLLKSDKTLKRYGATIERALHTWEVSPQEWADYIAFLGRLLKAIQAQPKDAPLLPHSSAIASKLAQCLNPTLPSGVHQKALEVYAYIFAAFGQDFVSSHLNEFLPGLSSVLSFASLSIRPALYRIFEEHVVCLDAEDLRPALKSLILSLLPALEEESSEDFEKAFKILQTLERAFASADESTKDKDGYFWQCLFLAVITSPTRRQGALNYFGQRLPTFVSDDRKGKSDGAPSDDTGTKELSAAAQAVVSPEPGLLIRSFVCGLSDPQLLIQRGFLDLLVTRLPLNSPLLQHRLGKEDVDRLVTAATHVLLRREMSLNRRLWSWFLGQEPKSAATESEARSPNTQKNSGPDAQSDLQYRYFSNFGRAPLERCILAMFDRDTTFAADRARPYRICLSLMDRWEIGGSIVSHVFIPAIQRLHEYSKTSTREQTAEVVRSASLFFDGIEAGLIWAKLLGLLRDSILRSDTSQDGLELFAWTVRNFNVKDEEMLTVHIPYAVTYLLTLVTESGPFGIPDEMRKTVLDVALMLMELTPERSFIARNNQSLNDDARASSSHGKHVRASLDEYYQAGGQVGKHPPLSLDQMVETLCDSVTTLVLHDLELSSRLRFPTQSTSLWLLVKSKVPDLAQTKGQIIFDQISSITCEAQTNPELMNLPAITSIISLLGALQHHQRQKSSLPYELGYIGPAMTVQIWRYLSPSLPKYHVEAVKAMWQMHDLVSPSDSFEASLTELICRPGGPASPPHPELEESARRFAVLWGHTIPTHVPGARTGAVSTNRRSNAMPNSTDSKQTLQRQDVLTGPLMNIIDLINGESGSASEFVVSWIQGLPTLETVFATHFAALGGAPSLLKSPDAESSKASKDRHHHDEVRNREYILGHFSNILQNAIPWTWTCLNDATPSTASSADNSTIGTTLLAEWCCNCVCSRADSPKLTQVAISVLGILLAGPSAVSLKTQDLDSRLMARLMELLSQDNGAMQAPMLSLIVMALKLRFVDESSVASAEARPRGSISTQRPSLAANRSPVPPSSPGPGIAAPSELLTCLRTGFSSRAARLHLDRWLTFLSNVLPMFADAIFAGLIPLVDCFCRQLTKTHEELLSMASVTSSQANPLAPEETVIALLDGLEMIIARAHECLIDDQSTEPSPKPPHQSRTLFGNVASGSFKAEGPPSKTSYANSRLTVILTFQDAIRVSAKLWVWASHHTETADFDRTSAATTSYNAVRIRNRTRHLLEQIFEVEPLESLEVVISNWCHAGESSPAMAPLNLLHVMQGSRPKIIIPAILDSLCSRINPSALLPAHQSSQTTGLASIDVAQFLLAYLQSTEDDAMDEIWSDIVAFLKDVLTNLLLYRQILPALLSVILLLAQKVDNTNFGEQRKMRRELGDVFLRLLSATFTTMPSGAAVDPHYADASTPKESLNAAQGRKKLSLVIVLKEIVPNLELILETSDRATTAVNNISSAFISPLFHARSFPANVSPDTLALQLELSKKSPLAKPWKKELTEAFNDARVLTTQPKMMEEDWFPVFRQWCLHDTERMLEIISRLAPPSSAGIMFGVGASAARLEADRKTQLNVRRICLLLLSSPEDSFAAHARSLEEKLAELFDANPSSSPSSAIKAELFMLCRALVLSFSAIQLAPFWPVIDANLQAALTSLFPHASEREGFGNLSLLQACKLLDLLVTVSPDDFQLHEWLYASDTVDAVYQPRDWDPAALSDQVALALAGESVEDGQVVASPLAVGGGSGSRRRLLVENDAIADKEDLKAMSRDDFVRAVLRPFLSQLSLHAYEGVYSMDVPDVQACRRNLLEDLLDLTTIVE